uniref:Uncharacterized protein n=1 Tax=Aegilops tauschii subsp. strangulata TaxID=200361 RepID=A0A452ZP29_AEGTS
MNFGSLLHPCASLSTYAATVCLIVFLQLQNWSSSGLLEKMKKLSERRKLEDLTIGPVLTVGDICTHILFFSNFIFMVFALAGFSC